MEQAPDPDPGYYRRERAKALGSFTVFFVGGGLLTAAGIGIAEAQPSNVVAASLVVDTAAVGFTAGAVDQWRLWNALRDEQREQQ